MNYINMDLDFYLEEIFNQKYVISINKKESESSENFITIYKNGCFNEISNSLNDDYFIFNNIKNIKSKIIIDIYRRRIILENKKQINIIDDEFKDLNDEIEYDDEYEDNEENYEDYEIIYN